MTYVVGISILYDMTYVVGGSIPDVKLQTALVDLVARGLSSILALLSKQTDLSDFLVFDSGTPFQSNGSILYSGTLFNK